MFIVFLLQFSGIPSFCKTSKIAAFPRSSPFNLPSSTIAHATAKKRAALNGEASLNKGPSHGFHVFPRRTKPLKLRADLRLSWLNVTSFSLCLAIFPLSWRLAWRLMTGSGGLAAEDLKLAPFDSLRNLERSREHCSRFLPARRAVSLRHVAGELPFWLAIFPTAAKERGAPNCYTISFVPTIALEAHGPASHCVACYTALCASEGPAFRIPFSCSQVSAALFANG